MWVSHRDKTLEMGSGPLGAGNFGSQIPQQGLEKGCALVGHIHLDWQGEMLQEGQSGAPKAKAQEKIQGLSSNSSFAHDYSLPPIICSQFLLLESPFIKTSHSIMQIRIFKRYFVLLQ